MKHTCQDCQGHKANAYAPRCRPCAMIFRKANPNPEIAAARTAKLHEFWASRPFDKLGRRAKKDRVLLEQNGKCLWCGIVEEWNGKPLVFQLDHINGDRTNNTRENLRCLCPNCHTQTPTFASRIVSDDARERIVEAAKRGAKTTENKRKKHKEEGDHSTFHHSA